MRQSHRGRRRGGGRYVALWLSGILLVSAGRAEAIGNLEPTALSCNPTSGPPGTSVQVDFTVLSTDRRESPDFYVGVWFSDDSDCATAGDNTYLGQTLISGLGPETSVSDSLAASIPADAAGATTSAICLVVDHTDLVLEVVESDNEASTPFAVTFPNLTVEQAACPATAAPGQTILVEFNVHNSGSAPAPQFAVDLWFSHDDSCATEADNVLLEQISIGGGLPAGGSDLRMEYTTIPSDASLGSLARCCVIVDPADQILESNEEDNAAGCGVSIRAIGEVVGGVDVRIGGARSGATSVEFGRDQQSGALVALVLWGADGFSLNRSADGGRSWSETYFSDSELETADLAVVCGYAYLGLATSNDPNTATVMRFSSATGEVDATYPPQVLATAGTPSDFFKEIRLGSVAYTGGGVVSYATLNSGGEIHAYWESCNDPGQIQEDSPGVSNASSGLDYCFNEDLEAPSNTYYDLVSYIGDDNKVYLVRGWGSGWASVEVGPYSGVDGMTRVTGADDQFAVIYQASTASGLGCRYVAGQVDAGQYWYLGPPTDFSAPGQSYQSCATSSRGWSKRVAVFSVETGSEPDEIRYSLDGDLYYELEQGPVNDHDVQLEGGLAVGWTGREFGAIYIASPNGIPYFEILGTIFDDGFETGDLSRWQASKAAVSR